MKLDELFEFEPQFNLKYFLFQVLHKLDTSFVSACIALKYLNRRSFSQENLLGVTIQCRNRNYQADIAREH